MSANEHAKRSQDEATARKPARGPAEHAAYYASLAERLESLLRDMQEKGTPADDALLLRLADLVSETRGRLRKLPKEK